MWSNSAEELTTGTLKVVEMDSGKQRCRLGQALVDDDVDENHKVDRAS